MRTVKLDPILMHGPCIGRPEAKRLWAQAFGGEEEVTLACFLEKALSEKTREVPWRHVGWCLARQNWQDPFLPAGVGADPSIKSICGAVAGGGSVVSEAHIHRLLEIIKTLDGD